MKVRIGIAALLIALVATTGVWAQSSYEKHPGFVDKQAFLSSVDDDDVMIEIWLPGSLLGIVKGVDEELGDLVDGLELAQAVVVEARGSGKAEKLDEQLKSIARESTDRTKRRQVKEGDELWRFAAAEYRDPARWKWIAENNELDNPRLLETGSELRLPPLE